MNTLQYSTPEIARKPWLNRIVAVVALAASITAANLAVESNTENSRAQADVIHHVEGADSEGLWLRTEPSTESQKIALMPEGAEFAIQCWTEGQNIDGNTIWQKGVYNGQEGLASDRYLDTGNYPTGEELTASGIPECVGQSGTNPINTTDLQCSPILLIGARGSGESYQINPPSQEVGFGVTLSSLAANMKKYYGGELTSYGLPYSAVSAMKPLSNIGDGTYQQSASEGTSMLINLLNHRSKVCNKEKYFLVGYSQGADVVGDAVTRLSPVVRSKLAGVALFGDPKFNPYSATAAGTFLKDASGIFGMRSESPSDTLDKVKSYCSKGDPICNYNEPLNILSHSPHYRYAPMYTDDAASFLQSRLRYDSVGNEYENFS